MEKPLVVAREEFVSGFWQLVGNSGLPMCMIADILGVCLPEIRNSASQEYEMELKNYQEQCMMEQKEEEVEEA